MQSKPKKVKEFNFKEQIPPVFSFFNTLLNFLHVVGLVVLWIF